MRVELDNGCLSCTILPFGATLQSLRVAEQELMIGAGSHTPVDAALIPTGERYEHETVFEFGVE